MPINSLRHRKFEEYFPSIFTMLPIFFTNGWVLMLRFFWLTRIFIFMFEFPPTHLDWSILIIFIGVSSHSFSLNYTNIYMVIRFTYSILLNSFFWTPKVLFNFHTLVFSGLNWGQLIPNNRSLFFVELNIFYLSQATIQLIAQNSFFCQCFIRFQHFIYPSFHFMLIWFSIPKMDAPQNILIH